MQINKCKCSRDFLACKERPGSLFYQVEVLVEVPPEEHHTWDSGCDELHLIHFIASGKVMEYTKVSEDYFHKHKYDIFDENGGI